MGCSECAAYGDDYFVNNNGELECRCSRCRSNGYDPDDEEYD